MRHIDFCRLVLYRALNHSISTFFFNGEQLYNVGILYLEPRTINEKQESMIMQRHHVLRHRRPKKVKSSSPSTQQSLYFTVQGQILFSNYHSASYLPATSFLLGIFSDLFLAVAARFRFLQISIMAPNQNKSVSSRNVRWSLLSETDKKDILRKRNTQNARESRKKWKISDNEIQELFESNEQKILGLEKLVVEMTKELDRKSDTSSLNSSTSTKRY